MYVILLLQVLLIYILTCSSVILLCDTYKLYENTTYLVHDITYWAVSTLVFFLTEITIFQVFEFIKTLINDCVCSVSTE